MKVSYLSIIIISFSFFTLNAQWSTDPNNNLIVGYGLDPHICSDSTGGCYVTYDYESTNYPRKLGLERIDKYGYKPWGILKQIFGELPGQWHANITEDGEEGVIVSFQDTEINGSLIIANVRVQRVDSNGNYLWGQTGVRVTMSEANQGSQELVTDGDGGCIIVWQYYDGIYSMNRINRFGQRVWGETGIDLGTSAFSERPIIVRATDGNYYVETGEYIYRIRNNGEIVRRDSVTLGYIVPDAEGGIVLSGRVGNINNRRLVAQRQDSLGNNLWQEPYVEIADSLHINTMLSIIQNNGYYFYGWMGKKNGNSEILQVQGLRNNGSLLFVQGSISLSNSSGNTTYIPIVPSDSGSCIFIGSFIEGTFGQKIDTLGFLRWNSNRVLLNYPHIGLDRSYVTTDCISGAIGLGDYLTDFKIPVFKVSTNGILGEIITEINANEEEPILRSTVLFQNFPNPFNSTTIIKYQIPESGNVSLKVYDILGSEVATLVNEAKQAGKYEISFDASRFASGFYIYRLQANDFVNVKKLVLLK